MNRIITLTTDFGAGGWYVASMKGVILSINPLANVVDVEHCCPPQDVRAAAYIIDKCDYFPTGTIHVMVVDPGVGSQRAALVVKLSNMQVYVCPDNGILTYLLRKYSVVEAYSIENHEYIRGGISATFHGRDIFAPAAAFASLGRTLSSFGRPATNLVALSIRDPTFQSCQAIGEICYIDHFGNLISNIHRTSIDKPIDSVSVGNHTVNSICEKYCDVAASEILMIYSSEGFIEVSVNMGDASKTLNVGIGAEIIVKFTNIQSL